MNASASPDTKKKILQAAARLFAKKGFSGTSIRDIAGAAEVNVAAINYHFHSKQALYWAVTADSRTWLEEEIGKMAGHHHSTVDLALAIFDFLGEHGSVMRNAFMMFLSDSAPEIDETLKKELKREDVGPPGGQYLLEKISADLGEQIPLEGRKWAVKNIFTCIFHWALMMEAGHCKTLYKKHPDFQPEQVRKNMAYNVQSAMEFVKNHPQLW